MKTVKYQSAIVKKPYDYVVCSHLGRHYISNGEVAVCIPSDECYVDVGKLIQRKEHFGHLFDHEPDCVELELTGEGYITQDAVLIQLAGKDRVRWVKQRILRPFMKKDYALLDGEGCVQVFELSSKQVVAIVVKSDIEKYRKV